MRQSWGRKRTSDRERIHVCPSGGAGLDREVACHDHDVICRSDFDDQTLVSCPPNSEVHSAHCKKNRIFPKQSKCCF